MILQKQHLFPCFHALCNDAELTAPCHADYCGHDRGFVRGGCDLADERLIDFKDVDWKLPGRGVNPDERVLVAGTSLELIGQLRLVALNHGHPVYISRDDATVGTRFLTALGQLCFLRKRSL